MNEPTQSISHGQPSAQLYDMQFTVSLQTSQNESPVLFFLLLCLFLIICRVYFVFKIVTVTAVKALNQKGDSFTAALD